MCRALGIKDVINNIYIRCVENVYWEGYNGQAVCVYDDAFQMKDNASAPNLEFFEIIRTIGPFICPLHMADMSRKTDTFFTSPVVILSTNAAHVRVQSLTYEDAVWNRLTHSWKVTIKPEYQTMVNDPATGLNVPKLNVAKALADAPEWKDGKGVPVNMNVYLFHRFCANDRHNPRYDAPIEYDAFIKIHQEELLKRIAHGIDYSAFIKDYANLDKRYFQAAPEQEQIRLLDLVSASSELGPGVAQGPAPTGAPLPYESARIPSCRDFFAWLRDCEQNVFVLSRPNTFFSHYTVTRDHVLNDLLMRNFDNFVQMPDDPVYGKPINEYDFTGLGATDVEILTLS